MSMMNAGDLILVSLLFFSIATAYSTVGHAGASGYLALMALLSFSPTDIKPISLLLNILVAVITAYRFIREGHFDKKIFFSFCALSIPMAFVGGYLQLNEYYFKIFAGVFLLLSALYLVSRLIFGWSFNISSTTISPWKMYTGGGLIGFVSGLIGVGGGIFLSPILLAFAKLEPKKVSGISALFILVNSIIGLAGHRIAVGSLPSTIWWWALAVVLGGLLGSYFGSKRIDNRGIYILLSLILLGAGIKMLLI